MQEKAFLERIEANKGIIYKVVHLYADTDVDKQDLYQDIVYQVWKAYPNFRGDSQFSTWLYRISLNVCLSHLRQQKTANKHRFAQSDATSYHQRRLTERSDLLFKSIKQLSEVDRGVILLHLEDYNNDEIADLLGMTKNNIAVKIHRIKEYLKNQLTAKS